MIEEIRQQPEALERTLTGEFRRVEKLRALLEKRRPRMVVLAARGTSDNAAQFGRYLIEIATGIPVSLAAPSVCTLYGARVDYSDALVVGLSQSGESTDVNLVLERAREQGALTIGITNESRSGLARIAEHTILVRAKREKSVAATKTYTGQLLAMYLLAYALGGKIKISDLERLPEWTSLALKPEPAIAEMACRYRYMRNAVVVGRGLNYSNTFEFALKMMETCYVAAERFSSADFQHGPIAVVEPGFPVFAFAPADVTWKTLGEMLDKLGGMKAEIIAITDAGNREVASKTQRLIRFPGKLDALYTPIPYIVPAQLFAAYLAAEKGLNPDQPRSLSKVTRTI